jgi:hypothetical protein
LDHGRCPQAIWNWRVENNNTERPHSALGDLGPEGCRKDVSCNEGLSLFTAVSNPWAGTISLSGRIRAQNQGASENTEVLAFDARQMARLLTALGVGYADNE